MVLAASILGLAQSAGAANPPATAKPASTAPIPAAKSPAAAPTPAAKPATAPVEDPKHAACEKTWHAQTKHTGKHKAFIAACVAKG
jgi:hypothetical protein